MKKDRAARKRIAEVRRALETPNKTKGRDALMFGSVHSLATDVSRWAKDPDLAEEALDLWRSLVEHQGRGGQMSARAMSNFLRHLASTLKWDLFERPESSKPELFELAGTLPAEETGPQTAVARALLEEAARMVGSRRSRSRRMGELRAAFWNIILELHPLASDSRLRELALKIAGDTKAQSNERAAALEFLVAPSDKDSPDDAVKDLLERICDAPGDEGLLVAALQAEIELGLTTEFGAMVALDDWRDSHGMR